MNDLGAKVNAFKERLDAVESQITDNDLSLEDARNAAEEAERKAQRALNVRQHFVILFVFFVFFLMNFFALDFSVTCVSIFYEFLKSIDY